MTDTLRRLRAENAQLREAHEDLRKYTNKMIGKVNAQAGGRPNEDLALLRAEIEQRDKLIARLRDEIELWKDRYAGVEQAHQATIKHADARDDR